MCGLGDTSCVVYGVSCFFVVQSTAFFVIIGPVLDMMPAETPNSSAGRV